MTTDTKEEKPLDEEVTLKLRFEPADDTIVLVRNSEITITKANIALSKQTKEEYENSKGYENTEPYRIIAAGTNKRGYKKDDLIILRANTDLEWFNQDGQYFYITHAFGIAGKVTEEVTAEMTLKRSEIFDPNLSVRNAPHVKPVIKS